MAAAEKTHGLIGTLHVMNGQLTEARSAAEQAIIDHKMAAPELPAISADSSSLAPDAAILQLIWKGDSKASWSWMSERWRQTAQQVWNTLGPQGVVGATTVFTGKQLTTDVTELICMAGPLSQPLTVQWCYETATVILAREPRDEDQPGERIYLISGSDDVTLAARLLLGAEADLIHIDRLGHKVHWLRRQLRGPDLRGKGAEAFTRSLRRQLDAAQAATSAAEREVLASRLSDAVASAEEVETMGRGTLEELAMQSASIDQLLQRGILPELLEVFQKKQETIRAEADAKLNALTGQIKAAKRWLSRRRELDATHSGKAIQTVANIAGLLTCGVGFAEIFDAEFAAELLTLLSWNPDSQLLVGATRLACSACVAAVVWAIIQLPLWWIRRERK